MLKFKDIQKLFLCIKLCDKGQKMSECEVEETKRVTDRLTFKIKPVIPF